MPVRFLFAECHCFSVSASFAFHICWLQILRCEDFLLLFVICVIKCRVLGIWTVGQKKQSYSTICIYRLKKILIMKIISRIKDNETLGCISVFYLNGYLKGHFNFLSWTPGFSDFK